MRLAAPAVSTPCTGVCTLDNDGYCHGCLRHRNEIAGWLQMGETQRRHFIDVVLPARASQFGTGIES